MIGKIRSMINSAKEIEAIKNQIEDSRKAIEGFQSNMKNIEAEFINKMQVYDEANKKILVEKQQSLESIRLVGNDFQKELNDFKVMKTKLRTEIIEKATSDIKNELNVYIMNIRQNIDKLNQTADDIKNISESSSKVISIVNELKMISNSIKKEDFELTKHAEVLRENDREKLDLLRKIDTLQRLVAKQRRQN